MTIYVDQLRLYGSKHWCHMASDQLGEAGLAELNAMADQIGMKRAWFQNRPTLAHYDLQPSKRMLAVQRGAVEVSSMELVRRCSTSPVFRKEPRP